MSEFWRRVSFGGVLVAVILLCAAIIFQIWISYKIEDVGPGARPALQSVLRTYFLSKVTGDYWENELLRQAKNVAKLPLKERLDFYRIVILQCGLDSYRVLLFIEIVGVDAAPLHQHLLAFKQSAQYRYLSSSQQKALDDWLIETKVISR